MILGGSLPSGSLVGGSLQNGSLPSKGDTVSSRDTSNVVLPGMPWWWTKMVELAGRVGSNSSADGSTSDSYVPQPSLPDSGSNEFDASPDSPGGIGSDNDLSTPYTFGQFLEGLLASVGAENEANRTYNAYQAKANRDFQERMSNTSYQRAVEDMRKAGLNPILAFGGMPNGASTPTGSSASYNVGGGDTLSSIITSLANAASSIGQILQFFFPKLSSSNNSNKNYSESISEIFNYLVK